MFKSLKVSTGILCGTLLLLTGCNNQDGVDVPYTQNTQPLPYETTAATEATVVPDEVVLQHVLKIETLGNVHWDGTEIAVGALGLEAGYTYELSFTVKLLQGPDSGMGFILQGNEPGWISIATTDIITDSNWHTATGVLDLSDVATIDFSHIQIVKNQSSPDASQNVVFLVDEITVARVGESDVSLFDFSSGHAMPFTDRGHVLMSVITAEEIVDLDFSTASWDLTLPSLAQVYADYFYLGNILEPSLIRNNPTEVIQMFLAQYNALTAENAMKPDAISGGSGQVYRPEQLNLTEARTMVDFALEHDLYMVGHTLVWHEQSAPWLYTNAETGEFLTREEAMENMRWFIASYAGYFGESIDAWDVTNEVFTNNGTPNSPTDSPTDSPIYDSGSWQRALRNYAPWYQAFANGADFEAGERGWDYIYYAFVFARQYAPTATLIYNDFNEEVPTKRDAIADMVEELNTRWTTDVENNPAANDPSHPDYGRLLIEVIGMQSHYNQSTSLAHVREAILRFISTGASIHITELDLQFTNIAAPFAQNELQLMQQADMFAQLFMMYMEFSDYIDRVSIWGREDGSSWRGSNGATHFDRHLDPKPAFWAIVDPVTWLTDRGLIRD